MRFCGFQNVTINLPQCAYRAQGDVEKFFEEVNQMMELAVQAHLQKRAFVKKLMSSPEMPLWQIGKPAEDGRPYVDLAKATYIIGLIGLNEAVARLTGMELHEGAGPLKLGLKVISYMYFKAKELGKEHGLKISLEESPAESASRRIAKVDLRTFPEAGKYVRGNMERDEMYYTNSIHLRADAPVDLLRRIQIQSKFHPMIESGAILHAFVGELRPHPDSIVNLVEKTYRNTQAAQLTISPEFTVCNSCNRSGRGLRKTCEFCSSPDVYGITRIVGYFSRVDNWNKSKLGELADRKRGNYAVV
jgi:anaerobic ribonucleoside-triphosphate reductase